MHIVMHGQYVSGTRSSGYTIMLDAKCVGSNGRRVEGKFNESTAVVDYLGVFDFTLLTRVPYIEHRQR